jgi:acyl dehydratase
MTGRERRLKKEVPLEDLIAQLEKPIGRSDWLVIDQARIDRFADCTLDRQWIHIDPERSAHGPFGGTIAHGFLTLSLIPHLGGQVARVPAGTRMSINYGFDRVRMIAPVRAGSAIRDCLVLKAVVQKGPDRILMTTEHTIEIRDEKKPACVADLLALHLIAPASGEH